MKLGVLFSGGKDSCYAMHLAKKQGHEISCLISIVSKNRDSFMFHTPSISKVKKQAEVLGIPLISRNSDGEKEEELDDLENAITGAIKSYKIQGIVTGALASVYQATRIQDICNRLKLECFNPLWQMDQIQLLKGLINEGFKVIIIGVAAYPLDRSWLGRIIDDKFVKDVKMLSEKYKINPAGEGGEFESFVLNCPMFRRDLKVDSFEDSGEKNSWRRELNIE